MVEQGDDQLMHFKWKDRTTSTVEDDLIIFPDDVEFKKVSQCTTGRVFLLKFKSTTRKLFFWMQEPKSDKDEEFCKKVNDYLNNPPAPGGSGGGSGSRSSGGSGGIPGLDLSNLGDSELQSLLNNMSQSQLMQLFGGGGSAIPGGGLGSTRQRSNAGGNSSTGSSSTATTTTTTSSNSVGGAGTSTKPAGETSAANIRLSDLQNGLSGLPASGGSSGPNVDLSSGLTSEVLAPLLENPEFVKKMKELLPDEEQQQDDIGSQVQS